MSQPMEIHWTRRAFVAAAGAAGLSSLASRYAPASRAAGARLYAAASDGLGALPGSGAVHSIAVEDHRCVLLGAFACERPTAFAMHPTLPVLYVANDCATWQNRPRATVEALALAPDGTPSHSLARLPLALSALAPRSLAISADGRYLLVSAFEGGAWNSFSLDGNGIPAPNPAALKEVGSGSRLPGQSAAHPHSLVAVDSGDSSLFVGSDYGADRLSLLEAYADGVPGYESGLLAIRRRHQLPAASGAMHLALDPQSGLLVASSQLRPALHTFRIAREPGPALAPLQSLPLEFAPSALAFHPRAGILYVTHIAAGRTTLTLWQMAGGSRPFYRLGEQALPAGTATSLAVQADQLWVGGSAGILGLALDPETGRLTGSRMRSFYVPGVAALLVHPTPA